ncbi:ABC-2 type transport system ATP-binding protein [Barrientosiimonas humi]|uniref:ABC-2 type transport system ATP-binding protein n=1 Tax=Barrientosiimonas humi TaxID=999931 RepID=A0A542X8K5_9MICO|nr:ABC transporter ATP-binding protein [Barrientosiimonas humi]TQL32086.1 ABC-2 type transport system ATP-binding protein [Barrientosiimonas humi]CAG7572062.1 putative ABC transporter ATP-binding protein YxlF [Barrientosiimonas humi]
MGVEVRGLTVAYRRREALARVSLTAQPGVVNAVLGPNGAGKTTLLSVLATAQPVGAGVAFVDGHDVGTTDGRAAARELLGWLPQRFDLAGGMRLLDTVAFAAWASGVSEGDAFRLASDALDRVGLASRERERVRTLSGGQRQRLGLAAATAHGPRVLLLDEPTAGLDPEQRVHFRRSVRSATDATVLLSTHLLDDAVHAADRVIILSDGQVRFTGTPDDLARLGARGTTGAGQATGAGTSPYEAGYLAALHGPRADESP